MQKSFLSFIYCVYSHLNKGCARACSGGKSAVDDITRATGPRSTRRQTRHDNNEDPKNFELSLSFYLSSSFFVAI